MSIIKNFLKIFLTYNLFFINNINCQFSLLTHIGNPELLYSKENKDYYGITGVKLLNLLNANYEKNISYIERISGEYKIPKKIHQIWLGGELPGKYKYWQKTIQELHPDWEYKLWTDKDLETFKLENKLIFDKAKNYGEKSDILRYEILYQQGGVYLDCDVECIRGIDFLHQAFDFYAGLEPFWAISQSKALSVGNAIIGCSVGHPIMSSCIKNIRKNYFNKLSIVNPVIKTVVKTGPILFTLSCYQNLKKPVYNQVNIIFPSKLFYPAILNNKDNITAIFKHYWSHSWVEKNSN